MNPISQSDPIWPTFLFFALLCWCSTFPTARLFYFVALVNSWLESSLCLWSWCCHSICKEGKCFCSASLQSCFFSSINITYAIWSAKKGFWCCWSSIWKKKSPSHFSQFLSCLPLGFEMSLNRKCDAVSWYTLFCIIYSRTKYLKSIPAFNLILDTLFSSEKVKYSAGFAPPKLISGLHQTFVFCVSFQVCHLVGLFVIETRILSIAWNDDIGPIPATL